MKGNNSIDELLISFLLNELNPEEEALITEQINSDTQVRNRFEELQHTWKLIAAKKNTDNINVEEEWKFFEKELAKNKQQLLPIINNPLAREPGAVEKGSRSYSLKRMMILGAVAACFGLAIVFLWHFLSGESSAIRQAIAPPRLMDSGVFIVKHEVNNSGKRKRCVLPDGSEIVLENKSEISYNQPFTNNRRDITLTGKADFKVAKDKTRPFTVYSLDLATTALGTHFTVSAFKQAENIVVRLFEGKIVIKSAPGLNNKLDSDYYLVPGQALVYNNKNYTAKRSRFNLQGDVASSSGENEKTGRLSDEVDLPEHRSGSWYMFNNQSAKQAFEQLKVLYNTDIVYSKKDIRNLYIIIEFNKTDSLEKVLTRIARANNLKVSKEDNRFKISR